MGTEKEILPAAVAVVRAEVPNAPDAVERQRAVGAGSQGSPTAFVPPSPATPPVAPSAPKSWKFVKNFGVADVIQFSDGSNFQFRLIQRNDGGGYQPNSFVVTTDERLANKLREAAKNTFSGIREVSVQ